MVGIEPDANDMEDRYTTIIRHLPYVYYTDILPLKKSNNYTILLYYIYILINYIILL